MTIYDRIRTAREASNMSQQELADKTGYKSRSAINKIEAGLRDLTQTKVMQFAVALNTTPAYLMGWEEEDEWDATLSTDETILIAEYNKLNELGKQTAIERVRELTKNEDYKDPTADVKFVGGEPIVKSTEKNRPLKEQTDDEYIVPIAARSGDKPVIKTSRSKIEEDAEKLPISDEEL